MAARAAPARFGGAGVSNASGATIGVLRNATGATIEGGAASQPASGETAGAGVANSGTITTLANSGTIQGGNGGAGGFGGPGTVGIAGSRQFRHDRDADQQRDNSRRKRRPPGGFGGGGVQNLGMITTLANSGAITGGPAVGRQHWRRGCRIVEYRRDHDADQQRGDHGGAAAAASRPRRAARGSRIPARSRR